MRRGHVSATLAPLGEGIFLGLTRQLRPFETCLRCTLALRCLCLPSGRRHGKAVELYRPIVGKHNLQDLIRQVTLFGQVQRDQVEETLLTLQISSRSEHPRR